jgi:transcription elongation factor GreA
MWHMADDRSAMPASEPPSPTARCGLTRAEFDELARELQVLRDRHQAELAERLRDARSYGSPGDNEDVLAVHEEASVLEARIGRLEELLRSAPVVDREFDGCASLGCTVRVAGAGGRVAEYVLVGRRSETSSPREVSSGSPVGQALLGARAGQVVRVELPDGRVRDLRIVAVTPRAGLGEPAASPFGAEAA